jgi:hypothetical protein
LKLKRHAQWKKVVTKSSSTLKKPRDARLFYWLNVIIKV